MSSHGPVNAYGDNGPVVVKFVWSLIGVYTVLLALRTYVRLRLVRQGGLASLILAYVAYFWGIAAASIVTRQMLHGVGHHVSEIGNSKAIDTVKLSLFQYIFNTINSTDFPIARFSVLFFLLEIQGETHLIMRRVLISIVSFSFLVSWIVVVVLWTQCSPPRKLWRPTTPGVCPHAREQANLGMAIFSGSWGAFTDLCLALYPSYLVYRLQMALRLKLLVACLMGVGVFSCACAIIRTYNLKVIPATTRHTHDSTYYVWQLYFWASAELWTILIASAIPPLWPLVQHWGRQVSSSYAAGSGTGNSSRRRGLSWSRGSRSRSRAPSKDALGAAGSEAVDSRAALRSPQHPFRRLPDEEHGGEHPEEIEMKQSVTVTEEAKKPREHEDRRLIWR